jgi:hypothetical protein
MPDCLVRTFGGSCWHVVDADHLGPPQVYTDCGRDLGGAQLVHGGPRESPLCERCRRRLWIHFLGRIQGRGGG